MLSAYITGLSQITKLRLLRVAAADYSPTSCERVLSIEKYTRRASRWAQAPVSPRLNKQSTSCMPQYVLRSHGDSKHIKARIKAVNFIRDTTSVHSSDLLASSICYSDFHLSSSPLLPLQPPAFLLGVRPATRSPVPLCSTLRPLSPPVLILRPNSISVRVLLVLRLAFDIFFYH